MAELKRRMFQLTTGKQIKLFGNIMAIGKSLEIGEGYVPNIFSYSGEQAEGKYSPAVSKPHN